MKRALGVMLLLLCVCLSGLSWAKETPKSKKPAKKTARKKVELTVPVDVGVGPTFNHFFGPLGDDQLLHYGLKFEVTAIITREIIQKNQKRIPAKYRKQALKMDEFRMSPFWWLPDSVFLSPKLNHTGVYGITFRPLAFGLTLLNTSVFRFSASAGAVLTYAYIHSDRFQHSDSMHFLRPGLDARAEVTVKFSEAFLLSFGWDSYFYLPQAVDQPGKGIFDSAGLDNSLWHNGQGFVLLHFRFPYTTTL